MCVFLGPSVKKNKKKPKQQALFAVKGTMVFLFNSSTSESLSELREVRVKRQSGGVGEKSMCSQKQPVKSAGSGYLTCTAPMSSEKCGI